MSETDARTWPENAQPTPEQFADYLAAAPRERRIEIAETLLDAMDRADWCFERGHQQRPTTPTAETRGATSEGSASDAE